jgi:hypothetical protein
MGFPDFLCDSVQDCPSSGYKGQERFEVHAAERTIGVYKLEGRSITEAARYTCWKAYDVAAREELKPSLEEKVEMPPPKKTSGHDENCISRYDQEQSFVGLSRIEDRSHPKALNDDQFTIVGEIA